MNFQEMEKIVDNSRFRGFGLRYKHIESYDRDLLFLHILEGINKPHRYMVHTFVNPLDYEDGFGLGFDLVLATNDRCDKWMLFSSSTNVFITLPCYDGGMMEKWYDLSMIETEFENAINTKFRFLEKKLKLLRG